MMPILETGEPSPFYARHSIATPNSNPNVLRGFTLLEIMLVMVVISVMVGLATVALDSNPAKALEREGRRLQALLQMAGDESVMQGMELALAIVVESGAKSDSGRQGYQFLYLEPETLNWQPLTAKEFLLHRFDQAITMEVEIDGDAVDATMLERLARLQSLEGENQLQPALLLLSSGEMSPFRITLRHDQVIEPVILRSDGVAEISLQ